MGVINPYPPPRTGARKAISLSFPCGGEGGNEDYSPSVCNSCCCCCFAPREMTNNCHSKRACVTAAAQLEQAALYHTRAQNSTAIHMFFMVQHLWSLSSQLFSMMQDILVGFSTPWSSIRQGIFHQLRSHDISNSSSDLCGKNAWFKMKQKNLNLKGVTIIRIRVVADLVNWKC